MGAFCKVGKKIKAGKLPKDRGETAYAFNKMDENCILSAKGLAKQARPF